MLSEYIKYSKFDTAGRRFSCNPISQEKCIHGLAVFSIGDNMKTCKDGRIWGQNNKEASEHLGTFVGRNYIKKGYNMNSAFPKGNNLCSMKGKHH